MPAACRLKPQSDTPAHKHTIQFQFDQHTSTTQNPMPSLPEQTISKALMMVRSSYYCATGGAGGAPKPGTRVDTNASSALISHVSVCPVILPLDSSTV